MRLQRRQKTVKTERSRELFQPQQSIGVFIELVEKDTKNVTIF